MENRVTVEGELSSMMFAELEVRRLFRFEPSGPVFMKARPRWLDEEGYCCLKTGDVWKAVNPSIRVYPVTAPVTIAPGK